MKEVVEESEEERVRREREEGRVKREKDRGERRREHATKAAMAEEGVIPTIEDRLLQHDDVAEVSGWYYSGASLSLSLPPSSPPPHRLLPLPPPHRSTSSPAPGSATSRRRRR